MRIHDSKKQIKSHFISNIIKSIEQLKHGNIKPYENNKPISLTNKSNTNLNTSHLIHFYEFHNKKYNTINFKSTNTNNINTKYENNSKSKNHINLIDNYLLPSHNTNKVNKNESSIQLQEKNKENILLPKITRKLSQTEFITDKILKLMDSFDNLQEDIKYNNNNTDLKLNNKKIKINDQSLINILPNIEKVIQDHNMKSQINDNEKKNVPMSNKSNEKMTDKVISSVTSSLKTDETIEPEYLDPLIPELEEKVRLLNYSTKPKIKIDKANNLLKPNIIQNYNSSLSKRNLSQSEIITNILPEITKSFDKFSSLPKYKFNVILNNENNDKNNNKVKPFNSKIQNIKKSGEKLLFSINHKENKKLFNNFDKSYKSNNKCKNNLNKMLKNKNCNSIEIMQRKNLMRGDIITKPNNQHISCKSEEIKKKIDIPSCYYFFNKDLKNGRLSQTEFLKGDIEEIVESVKEIKKSQTLNYDNRKLFNDNLKEITKANNSLLKLNKLIKQNIGFKNYKKYSNYKRINQKYNTLEKPFNICKELQENKISFNIQEKIDKAVLIIEKSIKSIYLLPESLLKIEQKYSLISNASSETISQNENISTEELFIKDDTISNASSETISQNENISTEELYNDDTITAYIENKTPPIKTNKSWSELNNILKNNTPIIQYDSNTITKLPSNYKDKELLDSDSLSQQENIDYKILDFKKSFDNLNLLYNKSSNQNLNISNDLNQDTYIFNCLSESTIQNSSYTLYKINNSKINHIDIVRNENLSQTEVLIDILPNIEKSFNDFNCNTKYKNNFDNLFINGDRKNDENASSSLNSSGKLSQLEILIDNPEFSNNEKVEIENNDIDCQTDRSDTPISKTSSITIEYDQSTDDGGGDSGFDYNSDDYEKTIDDVSSSINLTNFNNKKENQDDDIISNNLSQNETLTDNAMNLFTDKSIETNIETSNNIIQISNIYQSRSLNEVPEQKSYLLQKINEKLFKYKSLDTLIKHNDLFDKFNQNFKRSNSSKSLIENKKMKRSYSANINYHENITRKQNFLIQNKREQCKKFLSRLIETKNNKLDEKMQKQNLPDICFNGTQNTQNNSTLSKKISGESGSEKIKKGSINKQSALKVCVICNKQFETCQRKIKIYGNLYHRSCFKCNECKKVIVGQYHSPDDKTPYCMDCFEQKFALKCVVCKRGIFDEAYQEFRNRQFHNDCFRCGRCSDSLVEREFVVYTGIMMCPEHLLDR